MKQILTILLFFATTTLFAQTLYTRNDTIAITQDSVTLQAGQFRGDIQWQYSLDGKAWNNLTGKNKQILKVVKTAEGYYRAEIVDNTCNPAYSDTAIIKPDLTITKNITASTGGNIEMPDKSVLDIPANALQTSGNVSIGPVNKEEQPVIPNQNLLSFGNSYKLEIPGDSLLHSVTLTFTLDKLPDPIENYVLFLYNGSSYFPIEYTITGNTVTAIIDNINWETAQSLKSATTASEFIIKGLIAKQTPPAEEMGLKEVRLSAGKLSFSVPTAVSDTAKVLLLIHGWIDRPQTWASFVQKISAEKSIKFSKIWTFGYNSSWSVDENASRLLQALAIYTNGAKIKIVAHSMGGLVSRSMIEYYDGAKYVKKLITLGTPHHGSPMGAIRNLLGGIVETEEDLNSSLIGASVVYNCFTQGFKDLQDNSAFIQRMMKISQPPIPYYCIAAKQPIDNPLIPGDDDIVVGVGSALGVPKTKGSATINIISPKAHLAMLNNDNVYKKALEYLCDCDSTSYESFTDSRDGHIYKTIEIGTQTWIAENLAYSPWINSQTQWSTTEPTYHVYDLASYGVLYNWPAAVNACPAGWHLPNDYEWNILVIYLGGAEIAGSKIKAKTGWLDATNESCFSALPSGSNVVNYFGKDTYFGESCNFFQVIKDGESAILGVGCNSGWWSNSESNISQAWIRNLYADNASIFRGPAKKWSGFSVRCVKD